MFLNPLIQQIKAESLDQFLHLLWREYTTINPRALEIYTHFEQMGENIQNDHLAFRTFDHPLVDLSVMEKTFLKFGYQAKGDYQFVEKKLYAKHYEHPSDHYPKIFISQLKLKEVSPFVREECLKSIQSIPQHQLQDELLITLGRPWEANFETYEKLKASSN